MKVILEAFGGKLRSKPMDWPDDTGPDIRMVLDSPPQVSYEPMSDPAHSPGPRLGRFLRTGMYQVLGDGQTATIYRLVDI